MNELLQEGRYRIIRQIGQNDTGAIYEGLDNIFARKIFINQCAYNGRKNMSDEEKLLKGIKHEAFLRVVDYFPETNGWFAIMESEDGEFLSDAVLKRESTPSFPEVMDWTEQMLDALGYLHLHLPPIIFGDIKPQNVLLAPGGKIKLITSAVLKTRNANRNFGKPSTLALNYSPLEQIWDGLDSASQKVIASSYDEEAERILRQPVDARSDIYSLGVLIYELLTKKIPKNALERSIEILEGNPDPLVSPDAINADVPSEIAEILLKALEIRRESRFDSSVIMRQVMRTAFVRVKERKAVDPKEKKENPPVPPAEDPFELDELFDLEELPKVEKARETSRTAAASTLTKPEKTPEIHTPKIKTPETQPPETQASETKAAEQLPDLSQTASLSLPVTEKQPAVETAEQTDKTAENRAEEAASKNAVVERAEDKTAGLFDLSTNMPEVGTPPKDSPEGEVPANAAPPVETAHQPEIISAGKAERITPEVVKTDYKKEYSPDEFSVLFDSGEAKKRKGWIVPVVLLVLVLVGGAFGTWMFVSKSDSNAAGKTVSEQTPESAAPNAESSPAAENLPPADADRAIPATAESAESQTPAYQENTGPVSETESQPNPVLSQETAPTAKKQAAFKPRPPASKPQTASARTPEKQPKKVTVDDLISDY